MHMVHMSETFDNVSYALPVARSLTVLGIMFEVRYFIKWPFDSHEIQIIKKKKFVNIPIPMWIMQQQQFFFTLF